MKGLLMQIKFQFRDGTVLTHKTLFNSKRNRIDGEIMLTLTAAASNV